MTAIAFYLCLDKRCLVEVLALVLILVNPEVGEHLCYLLWHESAEDGITRILCGCWQDAGVEVFLYVEHIAYLLSKHAPLIVTEVINHDEEHLLALVK